MRWCTSMEPREVPDMAGEVFIVSVVFWAGILGIYILLNRRLARLTERLMDLERTERDT